MTQSKTTNDEMERLAADYSMEMRGYRHQNTETAYKDGFRASEARFAGLVAALEFYAIGSKSVDDAFIMDGAVFAYGRRAKEALAALEKGK